MRPGTILRATVPAVAGLVAYMVAQAGAAALELSPGDAFAMWLLAFLCLLWLLRARPPIGLGIG